MSLSVTGAVASLTSVFFLEEEILEKSVALYKDTGWMAAVEQFQLGTLLPPLVSFPEGLGSCPSGQEWSP